MTKAFVRGLPRSLGFLIVDYCDQRPRLQWLALRIFVTFLARSRHDA